MAAACSPSSGNRAAIRSASAQLPARIAALSCDNFVGDLPGARGTADQTRVYPREVVKAALRANAAAVIFAHNHPSGVPEPSHADEILTRSLKFALALVDVQVL